MNCCYLLSKLLSVFIHIIIFNLFNNLITYDFPIVCQWSKCIMAIARRRYLHTKEQYDFIEYNKNLLYCNLLTWI